MLHLNRYLILTLHATVLQKESEHGPEQNITTHSQVAKTISLFSTIHNKQDILLSYYDPKKKSPLKLKVTQQQLLYPHERII